MPRKNRKNRKEDDTTRNGSSDFLADDFTIAESFGTLASDDNNNSSNNLEDVDNTDAYDLSQEEERYNKVVDALEHAFEITTEKRSSKREQYLRGLFKAITQYTSSESSRDYIISKIEDTIIPACLYSLVRKSSTSTASEQYAACRVLEATSLAISPGDGEFYLELLTDHLLKVVNASTSRSPMVRVSALRALSLITFVGFGDLEQVNLILDLCTDIFSSPTYRGEPVPDILRTCAFTCWSLLATLMSDTFLGGDDELGKGCEILDTLKKYLGFEENEGDGGGRDNTSSLALKKACGECVALIHESRLNTAGANNGNSEDNNNLSHRRYDKGSWEGSVHEETIDEITQIVSELSITSGHHISKKAKKQQRATFRDIESTLLDEDYGNPDDPVVCETLFIGTNKQQLDFTTWREILPLNFVRHCLQSGFQIQMMTNPQLWDMFRLNGNDLMSGVNQGMSALEKRLYMSKTSEASKAADQDMVKKRNKRNKAKNSFINGDDL